MKDYETDLKNCPVCADSRVSLQGHGGWCWIACATCHHRGPAMRDAVSAVAEYNAQRDTIARYLTPRSERDAALAELATLMKRLADSPIGAVEVYEAQRYVGGKRVAVKLPESFEHGAVVRVVRVLAEDKK